MMTTAPNGDSLKAALERALSRTLDAPTGIEALTRRPAIKRSSFALEELDVELVDGVRLSLIAKDLSRGSLSEQGRLAKPEFLHDPLREPSVYQHVLPSAPQGTARYFGSETDPAGGGHWLFIERVNGWDLSEVGDLATWQAAARWAAAMHSALSDTAGSLAEKAPLLEHDATHFGRWIKRAQEFARDQRPRREREALDRLAASWADVVEGLLALPRTVIHGELYAPNVLAAGDADGLRICPVDWESASVGPGLIDLAALVTGRWSAYERRSIEEAYREGLRGGGDAISFDASFSTSLALCRLHLAVQWLGWAPARWSPPQVQRYDWLAEALARAREIGLT